VSYFLVFILLRTCDGVIFVRKHDICLDRN